MTPYGTLRQAGKRTLHLVASLSCSVFDTEADCGGALALELACPYWLRDRTGLGLAFDRIGDNGLGEEVS